MLRAPWRARRARIGTPPAGKTAPRSFRCVLARLRATRRAAPWSAEPGLRNRRARQEKKRPPGGGRCGTRSPVSCSPAEGGRERRAFTALCDDQRRNAKYQTAHTISRMTISVPQAELAPAGRELIFPASVATSWSVMAATRSLADLASTPIDCSWEAVSARLRKLVTVLRSACEAAEAMSASDPIMPACPDWKGSIAIAMTRKLQRILLRDDFMFTFSCIGSDGTGIWGA